MQVDERRFLMSPLGNDTPLFTRPVTEAGITHLAQPLNVPAPISRRVLDAHLADYYGPGRSLLVQANGAAIPRSDVQICNLSDAGGAWAHQPVDKLSIDPVLGRLAFPASADPPTDVRVTYHYGVPADMGGGQYERGGSLTDPEEGQALLRVPDDHAGIQAAIDALPASGGIVEITDSGRYEEAPQITCEAGATLELRAANEQRPILVLTDDLVISGEAGSGVTLNGLLIAGAPAGASAILRVQATAGNELERLTIRHCTLVPGQLLDVVSTPLRPQQPSLVGEIVNLRVEVEKSVLGGVRVAAGSSFIASDSIIDGTEPWNVAYAAPDGEAAGGALTLRECSVIGKVYAEEMTLVSNSILRAELAAAGETWPVAVRALRKQQGCVRFSWLPPGSIVPRRFRCQPDLAVAAEIDRIEKETLVTLDALQRAAIRAQIEAWLVPGFVAQRYGLPAYLQLRESAPREIRTGADDEAEMGAYHGLYQPQRETNLRVRLEEYLRFGLEAGLIYAT